MYINSEHKKAQKLLEQQKFEKALIAFNKALQQAPNHPDILSHRGVLYLHMNQKKKCFDDLELSLRLDKEYSYRYAALAYAKDYFGDTDAAIELYEKAIQVDPEDSISHNNLGLLMEKKGYTQKAKEIFKKADKLSKIQNDFFEKLDELEKQEKNFNSTSKNENQNNPLPKPGEGLKPKGEPLQPKKLKEDPSPTFKQVSKDLITKKAVFKEFIDFIKNGFKLKE